MSRKLITNMFCDIVKFLKYIRPFAIISQTNLSHSFFLNYPSSSLFGYFSSKLKLLFFKNYSVWFIIWFSVWFPLWAEWLNLSFQIFFLLKIAYSNSHDFGHYVFNIFYKLQLYFCIPCNALFTSYSSSMWRMRRVLFIWNKKRMKLSNLMKVAHTYIHERRQLSVRNGILRGLVKEH